MAGDAKLYTRRNGAMIASCAERLIEVRFLYFAKNERLGFENNLVK